METRDSEATRGVREAHPISQIRSATIAKKLATFLDSVPKSRDLIEEEATEETGLDRMPASDAGKKDISPVTVTKRTLVSREVEAGTTETETVLARVTIPRDSPTSSETIGDVMTAREVAKIGISNETEAIKVATVTDARKEKELVTVRAMAAEKTMGSEMASLAEKEETGACEGIEKSEELTSEGTLAAIRIERIEATEEMVAEAEGAAGTVPLRATGPVDREASEEVLESGEKPRHLCCMNVID